MRTPPVAWSAVPEEKSTATSWALPMFGRKLLAWPASSALAVDIPSIITRWSLPLLPWMVMLPPVVLMMLVPPTSWLLRFMPGISVAAVNWVRPLGIAASTSASITRCLVALCTSTIGDAPVTVTVSSSVPTRRSALTVALNDPVNSTPSRFTVLKPVSEKVTA